MLPEALQEQNSSIFMELHPLHPLVHETLLRNSIFYMTTAGAQSARNNPWEAYSDPYDKIRTPKLSPLEKIANGGKPLIVFAKSLIVDVWEGSEYATGFWATGAGHCVTMQFQEQILWRMYCKLLFAVVLVVFSIRPSVISKLSPLFFNYRICFFL